MEEQDLTIEKVKSKSIRGIVVLTGRTFILQAISLIAQLFLFAYLGQYEFGVFAIVTAVINFLVYFSDIGLAASLIQKKDDPTETDLKTTFTVQQGLVLIVLLSIFVFSGNIANYYSLDSSGIWLMYALGFSFLMSSLKSIPSVLLERKLEFVKLVFPQILEQVIYNVALVFFAFKGYGIASFSISVLLRGIVGLISVYYLMPWKPGFAFSLSSLRELFKFGIPYQLNTFLATVKDDGLTLVLGNILGPAGVGVLSFAQKVARYPLTFFMDTVTKVTFPAFSRMQDEKSHLERSVTRSIFFICLLVFPSLIGLCLLMPMIIEVVPKYSKWSLALVPLIFISINYAMAASTTQLTNLLNAIGKIKITFYLMVMWTILSWLLVPYFAFKYGITGASIGYSLVGLSSVVAIFIARKYVNFSVSDSIGKPLFSSLLMGVVLFFLIGYMPSTYYSLGVLVFVGIIIYGVSIITLMGLSIIEDVKKSFATILGKK